MADQNIPLATDARLATESRTRQVAGSPQEEHYQKLAVVPVGAVPLPLASYLSAASSVEMAVDGSTVPVDFDLAPADEQVWRVSRIVALLELSAAPELTQFGTLAALGNGLLLEVRDAAGVIVDLLGGQPVKTNADLDTVGAIEIRSQAASHSLRAEIAFGGPLRLDGAAGELLRATVRDNLSTLTRFRAFALGLQEEILS